MAMSLPSQADQIPQHSELLDDIRSKTGVRSHPSASALARFPGCLEQFWAALQPQVASRGFEASVHTAFIHARRVAARTPILPNHLRWMRGNGFSREDSRQIRYVLESICASDAASVVFSVAAVVWTGAVEVMSGHELPTHSESMTEAIGQSCEAFGEWPEYEARAREDLVCALAPPEQEAVITSMEAEVLPLLAPCLRGSDGPVPPDLARDLRRGLRCSSQAIVISAVLRRMFIRAEVAERGRWIAE